MLAESVNSLGKSATVKELVKRIDKFPEFHEAETAIQVRLGSPRNRAGRVTISHACYTNGGFDVAKAYFDHGTDTLSYIHVSEPDLTKLASEGLKGNLIVLGHIASDWLGLNRLLRELEKSDVEFVSTTDLTRT